MFLIGAGLLPPNLEEDVFHSLVLVVLCCLNLRRELERIDRWVSPGRMERALPAALPSSLPASSPASGLEVKDPKLVPQPSVNSLPDAKWMILR